MAKFFFCLAFAVSMVSAQSTGAWHGTVMGYYRSADAMPVSGIDFSALTHVIHDHARPNSDGTLDLTSNGVTPQASAALITPAHAAGVKVLLCVADTWPSGDFSGALNNQAAFISNIVSLVKTRGYDGVDIDWESNLNWTSMASFVAHLKSALLAVNPNSLLTLAAQPVGAASQIAAIAPNIDVIDLMSYELFWWGGQTTWHNSGLYDGGALNAWGTPLYSTDRIVSEFEAAGVPASKLAIGAAFYGHKVSGLIGTPTNGPIAPLQNFERIQPLDQAVFYNAIVALPEYQTANLCWDSIAQVPYLSVHDPVNAANDEFLSYDNPQSIAIKANYARTKGLAGMFIWALPYDYIPANAVGQQHPLLQAIKNTLTNLLTSPADITNGAWLKAGIGAAATSPNTLRLAASGPSSLFEIVPVSPNTTYTAHVTMQAVGKAAGSLYLDIFGQGWASVLGMEAGALSGTGVTYAVTFHSGQNSTVIFSLDATAASAGSTVTVSGLAMNPSY